MQPSTTFVSSGFKTLTNVDSNSVDLWIYKSFLGLWERWLLMYNRVPPAANSVGQGSWK